MEQPHTTNTPAATIADRLAFLLSVGMTPALVVTATMVLITWWFESGWRAWGHLGIMLATGAVFGMALAVLRAWRRGSTDLHIHKRRDRPGFFMLCAAVAAVGWGGLLIAGASVGLLIFMGAYVVCLIVISLVTLLTKPSVHCATMAAFTGALCIIEPLGVPFAALGLAGLVWARLHRKRHTLPQCVIGIAIGIAIVAAAYGIWQVVR